MTHVAKLPQIVTMAALSLILLIFTWWASPPALADGPTDPPEPTPSPPLEVPPGGIEVPLGQYEEPVQTESERLVPSALSLQVETLAPAVEISFEGIGQQLVGAFLFSPPDTHAATGPDRIVEVTNGHLAIYSKTGTLIAGGDSGAGAVSLNAFCGIVLGCFDPKVIYDQEGDRFVIVALEGSTAAASKLHIMVSKTGSPANLTSAWNKFVFSASATISGIPSWSDYPGLGVSQDAVVVTSNMFSDGFSFAGTKIRVFDKTELYDGDATATFVDINRTLAQGGFTVQPAHHLSNPPAGTFYLFQRVSSTMLAVTTLIGLPAAPTVSNLTTVTTSNQGACVDEAPQMGTAKTLETVCPRMMNAVWRDNSLWGTLTGSNAGNTRTLVQWFEYNTAAGGSSLSQHGVIDGGTGEFTFMPSISVDACGNVGLTYTQSSSNRFPEMRYTGRTPADPPNSMQTPVVARASAFFFDDFTGPPERWGDYSSTVVDPADQSFWVTNEYARVAASGGGNNGRWGTWHTNFSFNCTPPTSLAITKTASATVTTGHVLTYTITVANTGSAPAVAPVITDTIPTSTTLNVASLSGDAAYSGTGPGDLIAWTIGANLATGQALSRTFVVTVDTGLGQGSTIVNTGHVSATNIPAVENDTALTTVAAPVLSATIAAEPDPITATTTLITYTLTISNSGGAQATGVLITNTIPSSTTYIAGSASHSGAETAPGSGLIVWPATTINPDAKIIRTFKVSITQVITDGNHLVNTVSVSSAEGASAENTLSQIVGEEPITIYLPLIRKNK